MSEQIVHLGVLDDCRRLVQLGDELVCPAFERLLTEHHDTALLGSLSRGNHYHLIPLLTKYRDWWDEQRGDEAFERQMAYVLGWLTHRATDMYFKARLRKVDPRYGEDGRRNYSKIYHDAVLYRVAYERGARDPFVPGTLSVAMQDHPAADVVDVAAVERLFVEQWRQELLWAQPSVTDATTVETWINRIVNRCQTDSYLTEWYEEAFYDPPPRHIHEFINEPNFYDKDDPLLQLVHGDAEPAEVTPADAVAKASDGSQYAHAVGDAVGFLVAASEYFTGERSADSLSDHLDTPLYDWGAEGVLEYNADVIRDTTYSDHEPRCLPDEEVFERSLITVAAVDDARRLAMSTFDMNGPVGTAIEAEIPIHAGGVIDATDGLTVEDVFAALSNRTGDDIHPTHVAVLAGALAYATVRSVAAGLDSNQVHDVDAAVIVDRSWDVSSLDDAGVNEDDILSIFWGMVPRARQRWHTIVPDTDNMEPWMERAFAWQDFTHERLQEYAAKVSPAEDPRDLVSSATYDPEDDIIAAAADLQRGSTAEQRNITEIVSGTDGLSAYAFAVASAYRTLEAVDELLVGGNDVTALEAAVIEAVER